MRILAFETATGACTVAVTSGDAVLAQLTLQVPRAHSTRLMPLIAQAMSDSGLNKADLDLIAVGTGPGSFTGLRIGLSTAKGLAYALRKPCIGVPTLKSMAYGTGAQIGLVVPMLDAKRGDVYGAAYAVGDRDPNTWAELIQPGHYTIAELGEQVRDLRATLLRHSWQFVTCCGDITAAQVEALGVGEAARLSPAGLMLPQAWAVSAVARSMLGTATGGLVTTPDALVPIYLRKSEAERLWEAKSTPSSQ